MDPSRNAPRNFVPPGAPPQAFSESERHIPPVRTNQLGIPTIEKIEPNLRTPPRITKSAEHWPDKYLSDTQRDPAQQMSG